MWRLKASSLGYRAPGRTRSSIFHAEPSPFQGTHSLKMKKGDKMRAVILDKHGNKKIVDLNRRKAIRERCLICSAWCPKEVANCSFKDCPLHSFRSGKGEQNSKAREKAIKKYCLFCMAGQKSEVRKCISVNCPLYSYRMKRLNQSTEIDSMVKFDHIETPFEGKPTQGYSDIYPLNEPMKQYEANRLKILEE